MPSSASPDPANDLKQLTSLVVETRAAIDVVFEMVALLYTEKHDRDYYEVLDAMWQRHRQAVAAMEVRDVSAPANVADASPSEEPSGAVLNKLVSIAPRDESSPNSPFSDASASGARAEDEPSSATEQPQPSERTA